MPRVLRVDASKVRSADLRRGVGVRCRGAKAYALQTSFATTLVSTLDDRVSQLSLESLASKAQAQKRRRRGQIPASVQEQCPAEVDVLRLLSITSNLLFEADEEVKDALVGSGMPAVLVRLLARPEAREHAGILKACNQLLVNMVAGCASGQSAMVREGGAAAMQQGSTLLHRVMKIAQRSNSSAESLLVSSARCLCRSGCDVWRSDARDWGARTACRSWATAPRAPSACTC
eukprot:3173899-Rhodomonas_salina.3